MDRIAASLPAGPLKKARLEALTLADMAGFAAAMLADGLENPSSPLRKPALATKGKAGEPALRTVILRMADIDRRQLGFFTDARSSKVAELGQDPRASVLFYDPRCDMQLRLSGKAEVRIGDEDAWAAAQPSSRRAYLVTAPPGTPSPNPVSGLPADVEGIVPPSERLEEGRANFAFLAFAFAEADIVLFSRAGNRRARIRYEADGGNAEWLVP